MIKKYTTLIIIIFFVGVFIRSQDDFVFSYFVKKDTISFRWAPKSSELLKKGLKYGYTIKRYNNNGEIVKYEIPPFDEENILDEENQKYQEIIKNYISSTSLTKSEDNYTFGILLLSSSANKGLSKLLNLAFSDTKINKNTEYKYILKLNYKYSKPISVKLNTSKLSKLKDLTILEGKANYKKKIVYLKWEAESLQSNYSAYWIERSEDSINYNKITKTPYVFFKSSDEKDKIHIDYIDKNVEEGKSYWYRVKGITHFSDIGKTSNVVKVYLKNILRGIVKIDTIYTNKFKRIIQGKYEFKDISEVKNLKSFILMKSISMNNGFHKVAELENNINTFNFSIISDLESGDRNYYKVGAISKDNDTIFSFTKYFFTLDQIPPDKPKNLSGIIDSNGVVKLNWDKNLESDIRGYRVFKSNSLDDEFVEVTKHFLDTNIFLDTIPINNLTSFIYYRVAAVDFNYNNSNHSNEVKLTKPDTISPVACLFNMYKSIKYGVLLGWVNSTSNDIKNNRLIAIDYNGDERVVVEWNDSLSFFIDSLALLGNKTSYYIKTLDNNNNLTHSDLLTVNYETGKRESVRNFTAKVNNLEKNIHLSWDAPNRNIYSYKIYKSINNQPFKLIKTIKNNTYYFDNNLLINNMYLYKIKVVYQSGIKSEFSKPIKVIY